MLLLVTSPKPLQAMLQFQIPGIMAIVLDEAYNLHSLRSLLGNNITI